MRLTKTQLQKLIKETLKEQPNNSSLEEAWIALMKAFENLNTVNNSLREIQDGSKKIKKANLIVGQAKRYLEKSWEILKIIRGENKEALKEQTYPETGEPKQQFQDLVSDVDGAVGSLLFFGKRNYRYNVGQKAIRLSKELRKIIDAVALTESLSTRRALEDQEIEDSSVIDIEEPISKAEEDWEAEQNNLNNIDAGIVQYRDWAKQMEEKYGPDWEDILQNAEIDRMLSKTGK